MNDLDYNIIENYFINEEEKDAKGYKIIPGKNAIILTAPHSVSQIREGKEKIGEYRTGLIVQLLGKLTDCHIGFKTRKLNDDANYDEKCSFKTSIKEYIKENQIAVLIDFHLSKPEREFSLDIGTGYGKNINERYDLLNIIKENLELDFDDVKVDEVFPASYPHTVSATISRELEIPAIQLEINWKLVDEYKKLDFFVETMRKLIKQLEEAI